ncbi:hydrophobic protein [Streptomyces sp. NPDC015532]|uniref:hydrophobic protein n=1 Tax=Streptomyces sp. NPDC015532 TaxID=3364960 RepID=UPI0036F7EA4B
MALVPPQIPGFALKALWRAAIVVLIVWALGFVIRPGARGGSRGRWYRWQAV